MDLLFGFKFSGKSSASGNFTLDENGVPIEGAGESFAEGTLFSVFGEFTGTFSSSGSYVRMW